MVLTPVEQFAVMLQQAKTHVERTALQDGVCKKAYVALSRLIYNLEADAQLWMRGSAAELRDMKDEADQKVKNDRSDPDNELPTIEKTVAREPAILGTSGG